MPKDITVSDIRAARERLPHYVRYTPLNLSIELSKLSGQDVYLKLEKPANDQ